MNARADVARGLAALALVSIAGCSAETEPVGPVALYGEPAEMVPFPSDRYTAPADTPTGLVVTLPDAPVDLLFHPGPEGTVAELERLDGFSTTGGVVVAFSGPVDMTGLSPPPAGEEGAGAPLRDGRELTRPDSPFILIDVDPDSPERGQAVALVPRWWEQAADGYFRADDYTLVAEPAVPLRPATRYLFVVTDALRSREGAAVARSAATEQLLAGREQGRYAGEVAAALDELEAAMGVGRDRVRLATVFTTASITGGVQGLGELARAAPAPELLEPWTVETPLAADGRLRFRAVYAAPEYRSAPEERWQLDAEGRPIVQGTAPIEVFLVFSDANRAGPRPVVIHAHGLGGSKHSSWDAAERLAELNAAVVAIDSPHHGSRGSGKPSAPDDGVNFDFEAIAGFFGMDTEARTVDLARARDNFRQMASDQLELVKLIGALGTLDLLPAGAPDGVPDLDTSRILYIGQSFGAVEGSLVLALAPEITHAVWNVGGAGVMKMVRDSRLFSTLVVGGLRPEGVSDGLLARSMAMTQALVDPGDPLNFARFAVHEPLPGVAGWKPREVLIQQAVGDGVVPASSTEALARALGLVLVDPQAPVSAMDAMPAPARANLPAGVTGALCQFDRVDGDRPADHGNLVSSPEARRQYVEFFRTALSEPHATVIAPY